jgi:hypothetical protein
MQETKVPETPGIKREAALFDFFTELEFDDSPGIGGSGSIKPMAPLVKSFFIYAA